MASLNTGLNTALSGLSAAQTALGVTAHNISNAATAGYSRQSVDLQSVNVNTAQYQWKPVTPFVGTGVDSNKITQARDAFLDVRYRAANSQYSDYKQRTDDLSQVEDIFNEVSSSSDDNLEGLSGQLNTLANVIGNYQSSPTSVSLAATIKTDASNLVTKIRTDDTSLTTFESQEQDALGVVVNGGTTSTDGGINGVLSSISTLNKQIVAMEQGGQTANDLRDKRNTLLDTLSGYVDISTTEQASGSVTVQMESAVGTGAMLIDSNDTVHKLSVNTNGPKDATGFPTTVLTYDSSDPNNQNSTYANSYTSGGVTTWTGNTVDVEGGSVHGYLSILNGNGSGTGDYGDVGVNYLKERLNDFAQSFADTMNAVATNPSVNGQAASGTSTTSGTELLTYTGTDPAGTIALSTAWNKSDTLFYDNYTGTSIGTYAQAFINALSTDKVSTYDNYNGDGHNTLYTSGSLTQYASTFSNDVANVVDHSTTQENTFETVKDNLDSQRQSVSSVSIDEETVNLMKYQQMYSASARVITTINDMMSSLLTMAQ